MAKKKVKGRARVVESAQDSHHSTGNSMATPKKVVSKARMNVDQEGIPPLNWEDDDIEGMIFSPEHSLEELINGSKQKSQLSEWLCTMKRNEGNSEVHRVVENRVSEEEGEMRMQIQGGNRKLVMWQANYITWLHLKPTTQQ